MVNDRISNNGFKYFARNTEKRYGAIISDFSLVILFKKDVERGEVVVEYEAERVDTEEGARREERYADAQRPALSWILRAPGNKWHKYMVHLNTRLVAIYNINMFQFLPQKNGII